jgi:hypothetical protein
MIVNDSGLIACNISSFAANNFCCFVAISAVQ